MAKVPGTAARRPSLRPRNHLHRPAALRVWAACALAGALALGVAACGGTSGQSSAPAASTPGTGPGPATTKVPSGPIHLTMW